MTEEEFKKLIEDVKVDIRLYEETIEEVAGDIISESLSEYPVFIVTEHEVKVGELIADKDEIASKFNIYVTTLEELLERRLVVPEKKADFIKAYKDPKIFIAVMFLTAEIASFIFIPYSKGIK